MKTLKWTIGALVAIVIVLICVLPLGSYLAYQYGVALAQAGKPACVTTQGPAPVCENAPAATAGPTDEFGPEMHFPGTVSGPAIAELWNPNTGFCAVVKVNQGESLPWIYKGSWFQAPNVAKLDARWPGYLAEFYAKPSNIANGCKTYMSAADVPQQ